MRIQPNRQFEMYEMAILPHILKCVQLSKLSICRGMDKTSNLIHAAAVKIEPNSIQLVPIWIWVCARWWCNNKRNIFLIISNKSETNENPNIRFLFNADACISDPKYFWAYFFHEIPSYFLDPSPSTLVTRHYLSYQSIFTAPTHTKTNATFESKKAFLQNEMSDHNQLVVFYRN